MIFNKMLYLILFPILTSCNLHMCGRIDITNDDYEPHVPKPEQTFSDSYRDGSDDGIKIIDIPFC
jgi:hypothetical protein